MRGEQPNKDAKTEARKVLHDAAQEAKIVLAAAEKKRYASTAIIIGSDGEPLFHIVSTWWSRILILGYGVMLAIIVLLAIIMYMNKVQLTTLEEKVDHEANTEHKKTEAEREAEKRP